jgi:hypothetical protein
MAINLDKSKGELRIYGTRHIAINVYALCKQFDALVGAKVAETVMNNIEHHMGADELEEVRRTKPQAEKREMIDLLIESDLLSGVGIVEVQLPENSTKAPIYLTVKNPAIKATSGSGKAIIVSYWCGALAALLGQEFDVVDLSYDDKENVLKCHLVPRMTSR